MRVFTGLGRSVVTSSVAQLVRARPVAASSLGPDPPRGREPTLARCTLAQRPPRSRSRRGRDGGLKRCRCRDRTGSHAVGVSSFVTSPGSWLGPATRPVSIPDDLETTRARVTSGRGELPLRVAWSGPRRTYDLDDPHDRLLVYELVMAEAATTMSGRSSTFAWAGGAALVLANIVDRETRDLDYFDPSARAVEAGRSAVSVRRAPAPGQRGPAQGRPKPASRAAMIAWARSVTPSLVRIVETRLRTVFGLR